MNSKQRSGKQAPRKSSRRRFLAQGAVLAGLAAAGGAPIARGQGLSRLFDGTKSPGYVPEADLPKDHMLHDPWTGKPLRDPEGNILIDWTGTPQYEKYLANARAIGGPAYGWRKKDWRLYGYRSPYVITYRLGTAGTYTPAPSDVKTSFFSMMSPIQDQLGIITPASLHFHDDHGFEIPLVDPRQHHLTIAGMVERPLEFTMEDLMRLPSVSRIHNVECNSNGTPSHRNRVQPWATPGDIFGEMSCSLWTGVLLSTLLEIVGVKKGASWIWAGARDEEDHTKSFPLEKALDDTIVAYAQNGEPLRPEQGFPLRLVTPGWEGTTNIKRVASIRVTYEVGPHLRESQIYTVMHSDSKIRWFQFEMQPKSTIVRPGPTHPITSHGYYEIVGFAWAGRGKVRRVEITTDGGRTWQDARIEEPIPTKAMTRFTFPWRWNGEEVMLASRCTDEWGTTQPNTMETAKVWGVSPDWFKNPTGGVWRFNTIQPWKVDREGKVTNAILAI